MILASVRQSEEVRFYQAEGVITVEIEAAALFAVAAYREVELAAAFVVSDRLLSGEQWSHAFGSDELHSGTLGSGQSPLCPDVYSSPVWGTRWAEP